MKTNIKKILLVLWIIVIFVLTGYPTLEAPKINQFSVDKLFHFIVFFILGLFEMRLLKHRNFFLIGCSIVLLAEAQQLFIPGRDFEILDIFAGILGLVVVYFIFKMKRSVGNDLSKA